MSLCHLNLFIHCSFVLEFQCQLFSLCSLCSILFICIAFTYVSGHVKFLVSVIPVSGSFFLLIFLTKCNTQNL
jgi:hypothetical protein